MTGIKVKHNENGMVDVKSMVKKSLDKWQIIKEKKKDNNKKEDIEIKKNFIITAKGIAASSKPFDEFLANIGMGLSNRNNLVMGYYTGNKIVFFQEEKIINEKIPMIRESLKKLKDTLDIKGEVLIYPSIIIGKKSIISDSVKRFMHRRFFEKQR